MVMENWPKRNWKHKDSLWIMAQDHWALTHQLCRHLTMVDMVEIMVMEVLIGMVETIIASDTGKMTTIGQIIQRGVITVNLEEPLIMNLDRRRVCYLKRVVRPDLSKFLCNLCLHN